jgi:hypothetical protein
LTRWTISEDGVRLWDLLQPPTFSDLAHPMTEVVELDPQYVCARKLGVFVAALWDQSDTRFAHFIRVS